MRHFGSVINIKAGVFESWLGWLKAKVTGTVSTLPIIAERFQMIKLFNERKSPLDHNCEAVKVLGKLVTVKKGKNSNF